MNQNSQDTNDARDPQASSDHYSSTDAVSDHTETSATEGIVAGGSTEQDPPYPTGQEHGAENIPPAPTYFPEPIQPSSSHSAATDAYPGATGAAFGLDGQTQHSNGAGYPPAPNEYATEVYPPVADQHQFAGQHFSPDPHGAPPLSGTAATPDRCERQTTL